jgi:hypothetical protein
VVGVISLQRVTIGSIPDDVLLNVFDFYQMAAKSSPSWHVLVHVCQTWRYTVFSSPRRLDLRLVCKPTTPVRKTLDVWPPLPIVINDYSPRTYLGGDNITAALDHHDRVYEVTLLNLSSSLFGRLTAVTEGPFLALTKLTLQSYSIKSAQVLPHTFLGGSAPRLQSLNFDGIPFPTLPKLIRSSNDLVSVRLWNISNTGYFSPEALATCLSALTSLESLTIGFQSPASRPDQKSRRTPPLTRVVLPALTKMVFRGVSEYFEDLVARIDTPVIRRVMIHFFNQLLFNIPQFPQFVGRPEALDSFKRAELYFAHSFARVTLHHGLPQWCDPSLEDALIIEISSNPLDWQISGLAQICNQLSLIFSSVEQLEIKRGATMQSNWEDDIDHMQWLELLHPFTAVKNLDIANGLNAHIASALRELTGARVMEVLPALHSLSFQRPKGMNSERFKRKALDPFINARQLANHPVTINADG